MNYKDLIDSQETTGTLMQYKVVKKPYGWYITRITSYVTITKIRLECNSDGTAKAVYKVNQNYTAPYQYTLYFNRNGDEIKADTTRKELSIYKSIRG